MLIKTRTKYYFDCFLLVGVMMASKFWHLPRTGVLDCGMFCLVIVKQDIAFHLLFTKFNFIRVTGLNRCLFFHYFVLFFFFCFLLRSPWFRLHSHVTVPFCFEIHGAVLLANCSAYVNANQLNSFILWNPFWNLRNNHSLLFSEI